jgi:hypothetical protein
VSRRGGEKQRRDCANNVSGVCCGEWSNIVIVGSLCLKEECAMMGG